MSWFSCSPSIRSGSREPVPSLLRAPHLPKRVKRGVELVSMAQGARITSAGLVICRQRPQTASGVVFVTLEDETGFINLILYAHVFDRLRHVATTSTLLLAGGKIERAGEVVYIVADKLSPVTMRGVERVPAQGADRSCGCHRCSGAWRPSL